METVVPGHVQGRLLGVDEGVHPFQRFLRHHREFGGGVGPFKGEGDRSPGFGRRQDGLAVDHVGGPFLDHEAMERADQGLPFGQLQF